MFTPAKKRWALPTLSYGPREGPSPLFKSDREIAPRISPLTWPQLTPTSYVYTLF